jgi:hypothetical protein
MFGTFVPEQTLFLYGNDYPGSVEQACSAVV